MSCLVFGCEKASIELSGDSTRFNVIEPLPDISLSDLKIEYKEGVPFFEDARIFSRAHTLVSRTSQSEYLKWASSIGFRSDYFNLISALERAENPDYKFTKADMEYALPLKEGGAVQNPYHKYARLIDDRGLVFIGTDIHFFSGQKHVLVDEGSVAKILDAIERGISDPDNGVYVWNNAEIDDQYTSSYLDKVQIEQLTCPFTINNPYNIFGLTTLWWQSFYEGGGFGRTDEQKVGCGGGGCRQGTWGFFSSSVIVFNITGATFTVSSELNYAFDNRRRSGLNWIRTFPDVEIDGDIYNGTDDLNYLTVAGQINLDNTSQVNETTIGNETIDNILFSGVAEGNVVVTDPILLEVTYVFSNAEPYADARIQDGQISHKWTNRGNNPITDPIGVEFSCQ